LNKLYLLVFTVFIFLTNLHAKEINVQLLWKHQFEFAGFYMAKEKGYYKELGLDVNLLEYNNGIDVVDKVMSGDIEFGIGYTSIILDKLNKNRDIVLLSAIFQSSPQGLLSLKRDDISSVSDFAHKTIMINEGETSTSIVAMLRQSGVYKELIKKIDPSFSVDSLINGDVDLLFAYASNEPYILKERGYDYTLFLPKDYGFDFYGNILFTSKNYIQNSPKIVKAFRDATKRGWEYAFAHIDESVDLIYNKYNKSLNKSKNALKYEANVLKELAYAEDKEWGDISEEKIENIINIYRLVNLTSNSKYNFDDIVYKEDSRGLASEEKTYLSNIDHINMCVDPNWMPYEKIENKKHIGIASDYISLLSQKIDKPIKLVQTQSWSQSLEYIKDKKCDILSLAMQTPQREKYLNFTTPYLNVPLVIATKVDISFIPNIESLRGRKIAIAKDYAYLELLKSKYPYLNIVEVDSINEGLEYVNRSDAYAYIGSLVSIGYHIQKGYLSEIKISGKLDDKWSLSIAVREDNIKLYNILNRAVESIPSSKVDEILNKWVYVKYDSEIDYSLIWKIVVVFIGLIIIIAYSNYLLKQKIKKAIRVNEEQKLRLLEKSKKAQLGEMISIISHQWKQPLSVISSAILSQQISKQINNKYNEEDIDRIINIIDKQVKFMVSTIDDFRHFFNPNKQKELTDIKKIIDLSLELLSTPILNSGIEIKKDIRLDSQVKLYKNELIQVVLNLIKNAIEQFDKKQTQKYIKIQAYEKDDQYIIKIEDNAGGIAEDILPYIFDQYFSTKEEGSGTGLGLDLCKTIIEENLNGNLYAESIENCAIFTIIINKTKSSE
jgi:ABC-type nitrate/sulfonate/bicarbonate transport system substrate-binding protein/signal transduction histidine kinase